MSDFKVVTKEEFNEFIKCYDGELTSGTTTICEPPFISYRDESIGTNGELGSADYYFDKEVARVVMNWLGPNGGIDREGTRSFWVYKIKDL